MAAASKKKWNYLLVTYRQKDEAEKPFTHTHTKKHSEQKKNVMMIVNTKGRSSRRMVIVYE